MTRETKRQLIQNLGVLQSELHATQIPDRVIPIRDRGLILDPSILQSGKWYLSPIAQQINSCYEMSCFDACLVLMRRLIETLILEAYVTNNRSHEIQDSNGDFIGLSDLISCMTAADWGLSRKGKKFLPTFKSLGDFSAHSRMFIARRGDIENIRIEYRATVEELYHLSKH